MNNNYIEYILEIGTNRLSGLSELDELFKQLKETTSPVQSERVKLKIEKQMQSLFGPPFEIDLHYIGPYMDNCGVIPILKSVGHIEKTEDVVKLGNVRKVYIILGMHLVSEFKPREITSIFLHEIGHIVNHLSESMSTLAQWMSRVEIILGALNNIPLVNLAILPLYIITSRTLFFTQHVREYNADKFAVEYGYGDELISVMHKWNLQSQNEESRKTFWQFLSHLKYLILGSSHPDEKDRIHKMIEEIKKNYSDKYRSKKLQKILDEYYS